MKMKWVTTSRPRCRCIELHGWAQNWHVKQVGNSDSPDQFEQLDQASPQPLLLQRCEVKNLLPLLVELDTLPTDAFSWASLNPFENLDVPDESWAPDGEGELKVRPYQWRVEKSPDYQVAAEEGLLEHSEYTVGFTATVWHWTSHLTLIVSWMPRSRSLKDCSCWCSSPLVLLIV